MDKVADSHHILQRSGVWYYRRRVPSHLAQAMGKAIIQFSLKTKSKKEARKLRESWDLRISAQFDAIERELSEAPAAAARSATGAVDCTHITPEIASDLVRDYVHQLDQKAELRLTVGGRAETKEQHRDVKEDLELAIEMLQSPDDIRGDERVYAAIETIRQTGGLKLPPIGTPEHATFVSYVRRGLEELGHRQLDRWDKGHTKSFFDPLFDPSRPAGVTVEELSQQFVKMKLEESRANNFSQKSTDRHVASVSLIRQILGDKTPVHTIDFDKCLQVRTTLSQIPTNLTKIYKGLSLQDAVAKASADNRPTLSFLTQQQYLATFRELLALAAKKRLVAPGLGDDLKPLRRNNVAAEERRRPFTLEQIAAFFSSSFYAACKGPKPYICDIKHGWRFWLPLISLFTGIRPREACQAHTADIRNTKEGTWYLHVTTENNDAEVGIIKTLKTSSSKRKIPIHNELIKIGFLDYVKHRQLEGSTLLFPTLKPDKYGNPSWYPSKRFNDAYLPTAILVEERQAFYSFRHSFRDALRRIEASPDVLDAVGWSQGSRVVSDHYGSKLEPNQLAKHIQAIAFPGVDLSHLWVKPADPNG